MFDEIAADIAKAARERMLAMKLGHGELVSLLEHPRREDLAHALELDRRSMERALLLALKPVALDHEFCDIHIGTQYPGFISWTRQTILETVF